MRNRIAHFIKHNRKRYSSVAVSGGVALFIVLSAVLFGSSMHHPAAAAASLAPDSVGLGQGVAACASSSGITCSGTNTDIPVSWDETAHSCGNASLSVVLASADGNTILGRIDAQPCTGTYDFVVANNPGATYQVYISYTQGCSADTGCSYGSDSFTTDGAPDCSSSTTPPPPPSTCVANKDAACTSSTNSCGQTAAGTVQCDGSCSATAPSDASCPVSPSGPPSGSLSVASCTIPAGASTCATTVSWNSANSFDQTNNLPFSQMDMYNNDASGWGPWNGGSWVNGSNYFATYGSSGSATTNGSHTFNLPPGTYNPTLYGIIPGTSNQFAQLAGSQVTSSCASGTSWDGTKCVAPTPPPPPLLCVSGVCSSGPGGGGGGGGGSGSKCTPGVSCPCSYNASSQDSSCSITPTSCGPGGGTSGSGTFTGSAACKTISVSCNVSGTSSITVCPAPPQLNLAASPTRVRNGTATTLTWSSIGATSCTLTGTNGFSSSAASGMNVPSGPMTAQTDFTLSCTNDGGPASITSTVYLLPGYIEK